MRAGVDEAGRGPVLGPLVVAGVAAEDVSYLPDGVCDSKRITPDVRRRLATELHEAPGVEVATLVIDAATIDAGMAHSSLNDIEADAFARALTAVGATHAVVDTVGPGPTFARRLMDMLDGACKVEARPRADATDPFVGAASIVAKVVRDDAMERVAEELGCPVGSGYPSDPVTRDFLETWRDHHGTPPPHARRSWATLAKMGYGSHTLMEYAGGGRP